MLLYKKSFLIIFFLISTNLFAEYEIEINFESGFEFKSQQLLIETLSKTNSKRKIENLILNLNALIYMVMATPMIHHIFLH